MLVSRMSSKELKQSLSTHCSLMQLVYLFAELIQELQLKLRDSCVQVSMQQNFRPAPGTACCAQFSGEAHFTFYHSISKHISFLKLDYKEHPVGEVNLDWKTFY